ncbi:GNAT family N-acetyltransferase [Streptomyces sp. NPDC017979]|uniref:GNAT family N-acetyltransferase n=1 Tax=Streptomyces sp. NPDC017979 TaxID=3365024 RepID=UPI0037B11CB3
MHPTQRTTQQGPVTVDRLDGPGAAPLADAFGLVYAEAFAEPPYGEGPDDVATALRRFRARTRNPAFRAALARTADGEPVGMAYGLPLAPDTDWWDHLTTPVPADVRHEDGHRTFGLLELAVRAPWRGRGVARRLHGTLLDGVGTERVLVDVHRDAVAATAAYRAWGYRKVGESRSREGGDVYVVMVRELG